jgi:hypothetical protein
LVEFAFVSVSDGSTHIVKTYGEAMDSADKATNKAMSAAYKYACLQTFCIPTEGDNDADATTHTVQKNELSMDKVVTLNKLITETSSDVSRFLIAIGAKTLAEMSDEQYTKAVELLTIKKEKMNAAN